MAAHPTIPSIDASLSSESSFALSEERKREFIENGYLIVRDCFSPELAKQLVRQTTIEKDPPPSYRDVDAQHRADVGELDLREPETWSIARVYIDTGRSFDIEEFSPKLWGAIVSLVGDPENISRRTMGEQWILNGDFRPPPCPPLEVDTVYAGSQQWHIDEPGQYMTFENRRDALALLILWTDVESGGAGTLYTGQSLTHIVGQLEETEQGIDSRGDEWGKSIARQCSDIAEFTGKAGDVLITHGFSLHAPHSNYSYRVRYLENPMIRTADPLDYRPDNPSPSPVETAVISRLVNPEAMIRSRRRSFAECARVLLANHPDYFLPKREQWNERVDATVRARVLDLDVALSMSWVSRLADQIAERLADDVSRLRRCISIVGEVLVNQLASHAHLAEQVGEADFPQTNWSRLFRGFVNCEGQNYTLALLLSQMFEQVEIFNTIDPATGRGDHLLVRVTTEQGWAFADAWSPNTLYYVADLGGTPLAGIPEYADLEFQGDQPKIGCVAREAYQGGSVLDVAFPQPGEENVADIAAQLDGATQPIALSPVWTDYLDARLKHLMGDRIATQLAYSNVLRDHAVGGVTADVCRVFEERTASGTILARL